MQTRASARIASRCSCNDGCASAHALDLIGKRRALIIVRELLLGPKLFVDIQRDIPGIGPGPLTQRLQELDDIGILERRTLPDPARATVYDLSASGRGLKAVDTALSLGAMQSPRLPVSAYMRPGTLIVAMRTHARPLPTSSPDRTVARHLADSRITARKAATYLATPASSGSGIDKTTTDKADANVSSTTPAWRPLINGRVPLNTDEGISAAGNYETVQMLIDATKFYAVADPERGVGIESKDSMPTGVEKTTPSEGDVASNYGELATLPSFMLSSVGG